MRGGPPVTGDRDIARILIEDAIELLRCQYANDKLARWLVEARAYLGQDRFGRGVTPAERPDSESGPPDGGKKG